MKKCRVDIVTLRSIVRGDRCNIFACFRRVSLLALLAANEPLVSAVTEWKVSEAKTANMLKWKHMLLYAFPANMHFILFFPVCMCGKASLSRSETRKVRWSIYSSISVPMCLLHYIKTLIFLFIRILFEYIFRKTFFKSSIDLHSKNNQVLLNLNISYIFIVIFA